MSSDRQNELEHFSTFVNISIQEQTLSGCMGDTAVYVALI